MKRGKTTATLAMAATLVASSPEVHAAEKIHSPEVTKAAKRNPANRLAKYVVKQVGGRILNTHLINQSGSIRIGARSVQKGGEEVAGFASRTVTIDTRSSQVPGSNGEYTFSIFARELGRNSRLDRSDINNVRVVSGSASDGRPLFALSLYRRLGRPVDGPLDANLWHHAQGTAVLPSGQRVEFNGGTDPRSFSGPDSLTLDRQEIAATGNVMNGILDAATSGQPTQLVEPPFGPLQSNPTLTTPVPAP